MNLDPAGASGFLCAQGARFLLHSGILITAALLVARLFGRSGLARSAIYRAALLAVILAPVVSFSIERSGLSWSVPLPAAALPATAIMPPPLEPAPMYVSTEAAHVGAADAGPAHVLPPVKASGPMPKPATIIAALWAVGACLLAARLLISHAALWRTRRRSVPVEDPSTLARLRGLCERLRVRAPGLRTSPDVSGPILTGALRPVVIIPHAQQDALLNGALDRVLMHELAHQARRDCLWNLLARAVCTAGFFQPLLWVLARRLEEAGEDAADDRVLAAGADVRAYARDLAIAAERLLLRRPESIAGLGVIRFRSSLGRRVTHVLDTSRNWVSSLSWKENAALCALTVVATVLTSAISCTGLATNAAVSAGEPAYVFTVIGENAFPAGLNNGGQVVGQLYGTPGHTKAFQWSQEEGIKDLGTLPPPADYGSSASAINDAGDIIGHSAERNNNWHPFVRSASLGMVSIPTLGGRQASPISVNASGQIVGWASRPDTLWRAFLFKPGKTIQDLGSVIGDSESQALAINAHGWIVGNASSGTGGRKDRMHPVLWIPGEPVKDLGLLPGTESGSAADINDSGEVVGSAGVYRDVSRSKMYCGRPFIWTPEKGTVALPMPDYDCVLATHINKHGQILIAAYNVAIRRPTEKGSSASVEGSLSPEPWQIEEGGQFLLNKGCLLELPGFPKARLTTYCALNDMGQFIGRAVIKKPGSDAEVTIGFLATPKDDQALESLKVAVPKAP